MPQKAVVDKFLCSAFSRAAGYNRRGSAAAVVSCELVECSGDRRHHYECGTWQWRFRHCLHQKIAHTFAVHLAGVAVAVVHCGAYRAEYGVVGGGCGPGIDGYGVDNAVGVAVKRCRGVFGQDSCEIAGGGLCISLVCVHCWVRMVLCAAAAAARLHPAACSMAAEVMNMVWKIS